MRLNGKVVTMGHFHKNPLPDPVLDAGFAYPDDFPGTGVSENLFDLFENSTEQVNFEAPYTGEFSDPLHDMLDVVETATETQSNTVPLPPESDFEEPTGTTALSHGPSSQLPLPFPPQPSFSGNFGSPARGMGGGSTGIRNRDDGMFYCHKFDEWVSTDECKSCPAFEPDENLCDGEEPGCRYELSVNAGDER